MKKLYFIIGLLLINIQLSYSQTYLDKWAFGIGATYPRFFSVSGTGFSENENYGGYFSLEYFFNEQVSLRLLNNYLRLESNYYRFPGDQVQSHFLNQFSSNLDVIYEFLPCRSVSPYLLFGGGLTLFKNEKSFNPDLDDDFLGYQANFGVGVRWGLSENFALKTEAVYHTSSNNKIDGNDRINENSKGFFGGNSDTYGRFDVGILWYFSKGEPSNLCDKCPEGVKEIYYRDSIIVKEPYEVIRYQIDTVKVKEPIFFNVHFDFDKYSLRPEAYPILDQAVKTLNEFKDVQVVISGHTDSFGSDEYNEKLSKKRVETVYNYLINNGINPNRISKGWFGEKQPLRSNDIDVNRAFNRRVEIKISN